MGVEGVDRITITITYRTPISIYRKLVTHVNELMIFGVRVCV